ncbi:hypothetical protein VC88_12035 [Geobacillus sp. A8]|nr:hypothetical protein VC88_12035 [Geobacillus sp. A8]
MPFLYNRASGSVTLRWVRLGNVAPRKFPRSSAWTRSPDFGDGEGGVIRIPGLGLFIFPGSADQIVFQGLHRSELDLPQAVDRGIRPHLGAVSRRMDIRRDQPRRDAWIHHIGHQPVKDSMLAPAFPCFDERRSIRQCGVMRIRMEHEFKVETTKPQVSGMHGEDLIQLPLGVIKQIREQHQAKQPFRIRRRATRFFPCTGEPPNRE